MFVRHVKIRDRLAVVSGVDRRVGLVSRWWSYTSTTPCPVLFFSALFAPCPASFPSPSIERASKAWRCGAQPRPTLFDKQVIVSRRDGFNSNSDLNLTSNRNVNGNLGRGRRTDGAGEAGLTIVHFNARSLLPKIAELRIFLSSIPADVVAITES